ncbi:MAG: hypothetical protein NT031_03965 [Planctomycetota bacterium]|nr:hypothetical protein [Planctomycetota bacterium]
MTGVPCARPVAEAAAAHSPPTTSVGGTIRGSFSAATPMRRHNSSDQAPACTSASPVAQRWVWSIKACRPLSPARAPAT